MMSCHTQSDLQHMSTKFSNAAKNYGLQISITKTEVMYQPAPAKPYVEPTISIDNLQLPITNQFKYLGSVLSNDAHMDEDIKARISKASSVCGRLQERVRKPHGIKLNTKIKVYRATVLITLLYGAETWTCYRRHVKMLDSFHIRHLRYLMGIKWQDKITNNDVLQRARMDGIEAMLMRAQLRWVGHVQRRVTIECRNKFSIQSCPQAPEIYVGKGNATRTP